jgi:hypothetical protein
MYPGATGSAPSRGAQGGGSNAPVAKKKRRANRMAAKGMVVALSGHDSSAGEMQFHHRSKNNESNEGRVASLTHHQYAVPVLPEPFPVRGHDHFFKQARRVSFDESTPQAIVNLGQTFYENHYTHIIGITEMIRGTAELKQNVTVNMVRFWAMHAIRSRDMKHLSCVLALADDCGFSFEGVLGGESLASLMIQSQSEPVDTAEGKGQVALLERSLNLPTCLHWLFDERRDVEGHGEQIVMVEEMAPSGEHTMFVNEAFERHVETRAHIIAERKTMNCSYGWKTLHPGKTADIAGVHLSLQRQVAELAVGAATGSVFTAQRSNLGVMPIWNKQARDYKEAFVDSYSMAVVVDAVDASKMTTYDSISLRFIKPRTEPQLPPQALSLTGLPHSMDFYPSESGNSSNKLLPVMELPAWGRSPSEDLLATSDIFAEELTTEEHSTPSSNASLPSRSSLLSFQPASLSPTYSSSHLQEPGVPAFKSI